MNRTSPIAQISDAIRRERDRAGLSLTELAKRAGVAKSTLSQLEAGTGNPSVETLWSLAVALDVPFSRVVDPQVTQVRVIRAGSRPGIGSDRSTLVATTLAPCPPGARRDLHLVTMEPGAAREAAPHIPGTIEHHIVITGRFRCGPAGEEIELGPGDYSCFPGDVAHTYAALAPASSMIMVMEYR
jgi:transcriptional regulator with XRE-family HTH domain